ncbi:MAG TPA: EAL domain-containing protein [Pyrinomonadaceae bacterium]|jgi:diguanylate cyclase (GGDEF)-like protein/PAS domain S-box-containing protein|nr:EAL domain-containing protein [Pyrinomonadaceae bacterium]
MRELPIRVLLVDDDEDDYVMTRELLSESGSSVFQLDWVFSYDEAIAAIDRREHDVYLLDYRLGEQSGLDILRHGGSKSPQSPMILLTGQGDELVDIEAMKEGAADYLIKSQLTSDLLARSIRYSMERSKASHSLRQSEERYQRLVELSPDAIIVHTERSIVFVNGAGVRLLGAQSSAELIGRPVTSFVHADCRESARKRIDLSLHDNIEVPFAEEKFVRVDGGEIQVEVGAVPFIYENEPAVQMVARDISVRKLIEEKLIHDAFHDALTGLPNRALFKEHLKLAVERAKRKEPFLFAVLFLDLDRFKNVNDGLGHAIGDELLIQIARRLEAHIRPVDRVARFGGDEFAILLDGIEDASDATRVAERLQTQLQQPFNVLGHNVFTSASIGIAMSTTGYLGPDDVVRDADTAMYRAKALGKARYEIFDFEMHSRAVALLKLETDLRLAVERQEFSIQYQPIMKLGTNQIHGFEALVRWHHPERGLLLPSEFIPVAEETGLILPLGRWILREACRQTREWQEEFPAHESLTLNVNYSGKQFMQSDVIEQIKEILEETGFDPCLLQLEITESAVIENTKTVTEMILQLRALGIRLSMDDFGTGYSSLSYLHNFPIHTLKIDRSFISNKGEVGDNEIVRTIIMLARNLGLDVVAEGVETAEQLAYLKGLDCEYGQGFLFSHPLDANMVEHTLRELLTAKSIGDVPTGALIPNEKPRLVVE